MFDRVQHPARGRAGGADGARGRLGLRSGGAVRPKGLQDIPGGDVLRLELPGGGGFGPPEERDPALVARDVADGLVSAEAAAAVYRVALDAAGAVDAAATARLRGEARA
jgi:N-methylhydantoinase B